MRRHAFPLPAAPVVTPPPNHQRSDPKPGSRAHARADLSPRPEGVSDHTWERLAAHIAKALGRATTRGASQLRPSVVLLVMEMRMAGAAWDTIEATVTGAVTAHPEFGATDRLNVVSGRRSSEPLIARMVGWVHRARQLEEPIGAPSRGGVSDRIDVEKAEKAMAKVSRHLDRHLALARAEPAGAVSDGDVMDRALRSAMMELRFSLNLQTFEYLRWRVERSHSALASALG
jgi:hypothetical protein